MEAYEVDALARAIAAGSLVFMAEMGLWALCRFRKRIWANVKGKLPKMEKKETARKKVPLWEKQRSAR